MLGVSDDKLYGIAMELFRDAGIADNGNPIFINHTPEQAIYFDCASDKYLTGEQRDSLSDFCNVSLLFELDDTVFEKYTSKRIAVFSIDLDCQIRYRSITAYNVHMLLDYVFNYDASIVLFRHSNKIMLTFAGFGQACILSDWYDESDDSEIVEKIHVVNESLHTAKEFFYDIIYNIARKYYIYPISKEQAIYESLPLNCFDPNKERPDAYEIQSAIDNYINTYVDMYGDDYVEPRGKVINNNEISQELDLLLLAIEDESEIESDMDMDDENSDYQDNTAGSDDYKEFENLDPELFKDPVKMVKWLEKNM